MRPNRKETLEAELAQLNGLDLNELRRRWGKLLGPVPLHHNVDLMRRRLAYELQVREYGGLKYETRRRLRRLSEALRKNPNHTPVPLYPLKPGTMLAREWRGTVHRVGVMDDGFEYDGRRYASLSGVARDITGTRWSGPLFFGLRGAKQ